MSRPSVSVPSIWYLDGGLNIAFASMAVGSCVAIRGANTAKSKMSTINADATSAILFLITVIFFKITVIIQQSLPAGRQAYARVSVKIRYVR